MELLLIRHGEAESNVLPVEEGIVGSDRSLTVEGIKQMEACARYLGELAANATISLPDIIHSSPYRRTLQSARILSEHLNIPIETDARLREIDRGSWAGKAVQDVIELESEILHHERAHFRPPEGENWFDIAERMTDFVTEKAEKHQSLLVVGHNHPIECAIGKLTGEPASDWEKYNLKNSSITRITEENDDWQIDESLHNFVAKTDNP